MKKESFEIFNKNLLENVLTNKSLSDMEKTKISKIMYSFKENIIDKYNLDEDYFLNKLKKLERIVILNDNDMFDTFSGMLEPINQSKDINFKIYLKKNVFDDEFKHDSVLTHELMHLMSHNLINNKNGISNFMYINEIMTEKFTELTLRGVYDDYDNYISNVNVVDSKSGYELTLTPVGLGYLSISNNSEILFDLLEKDMIDYYFKNKEVGNEDYNYLLNLEKSLKRTFETPNNNNYLDLNKSLLNIFKKNPHNYQQDDYILDYLKLGNKFLTNSFKLKDKNDIYVPLQYSFEALDTVVFSNLIDIETNLFYEFDSKNRSPQVNDFIIVMNFLRQNKDIIDKMNAFEDIEYKTIKSNKEEKTILLKTTDSDYYELNVFKTYIANSWDKINYKKIDEIEFNNHDEIIYPETPKKDNYFLNFENIIYENQMKNNVEFLKDTTNNQTLKTIFNLLDEKLDTEFEKHATNTLLNTVKDVHGRNSSHIISSLSDENIDIILRYLKTNKIELNNLFNEPDNYNINCFEYLIEKQDYEKLNLILKRVNLYDKSTLFNNEDFLLNSAYLCKSNIINQVSKTENIMNIKDSKNNNVMHLAMLNTNSSNIYNFLSNLDINENITSLANEKNNSKENILNFYSKNENIEFKNFKYIIDNFEIDINSIDSRGNNALLNILMYEKEYNLQNKLDCIDYLLKKDIDVNIINKNGCTPLQLEIINLYDDDANKKEHYKIIDTLIKHDADIYKSSNKMYSPFTAACKTKDMELFKIFMDNGVKLKEICNSYDFKINFNSNERKEMRNLLKEYNKDEPEKNNEEYDYIAYQ